MMGFQPFIYNLSCRCILLILKQYAAPRCREKDVSGSLYLFQIVQ